MNEKLVLVVPADTVFLPFLSDFVARATLLQMHVRTEDVWSKDADGVERCELWRAVALDD